MTTSFRGAKDDNEIPFPLRCNLLLNHPIFSLPVLGGGQPGPGAANRELGQQEAWWPLPSRDDEHHV